MYILHVSFKQNNEVKLLGKPSVDECMRWLNPLYNNY